MPDDLKSKYFDYFEKINEKIKEFKAYEEDFDDDDDDDEDYDDGELVTGEYCFSDEDDEVDLLKPSVREIH